jgi:hypothetical protein
MAPLRRKIQIFHSQEGKLNIIRGAIRERESFEERFVQELTVAKNYGTLLAIPEIETRELFPETNINQLGTFELQQGKRMVQVVEWAIPTVSQERRSFTVNRNSETNH